MDQYHDDDWVDYNDDEWSDFEDDFDFDYKSELGSIPEELEDFYPEDNSCVHSFIELYILVEKLIKMIQFARNKAFPALRDIEQAISYMRAAKLISDLKVIKVKCKSQIRSSLGKLLPLHDTVLDEVLKSILYGSSLEEYKFEEVPEEDIGKINMMYGRLTSIFVILRDEDAASLEYARIGALSSFWMTAWMEEEEAYLASLPGDDDEDGAGAAQGD